MSSNLYDWPFYLKLTAMAFVILAIIVGNVAVIVSYFYWPELHSRTRFKIILSLALADILYVVCVIIFDGIYILYDAWLFSRNFCIAWRILDVALSTVSYIHIALLAFDQFYNLYSPLARIKNPQRRARVYNLVIGCIWLYAFAYSSISLLLYTNYIDWSISHKDIILDRVVQKAVNGSLTTAGIGDINQYTYSHESDKIYSDVDYFAGIRLGKTTHYHFPMDFVKSRYYSPIADKESYYLSAQNLTVTNKNTISQLNIAKGAALNSSSQQAQNCPFIITEAHVILFTSSFFFFAFIDISLCVAILVVLYRYGHNNSRTSFGNLTRDMKSIKYRRTLGVAKFVVLMVLLFLLCWAPFFILLALQPFFSRRHVLAPVWLTSALLWIAYMNSAINPILYFFMHNDIRTRLQILLRPAKNRDKNAQLLLLYRMST